MTIAVKSQRKTAASGKFYHIYICLSQLDNWSQKISIQSWTESFYFLIKSELFRRLLEIVSNSKQRILSPYQILHQFLIVSCTGVV